jgi:[ribosomal protein S5]-alanine N-acetyltransferase
VIRLDGERIYLRDHVLEDIDVFHAWMSDREVTRFLTRRLGSRAESLQQLHACLAENDNPQRRQYFFALVLKQGDQNIGDAGFTLQDGAADMGYFLLKPFWGQGYASEALRLMMVYCFDSLHLQRVTAGCTAGNNASERVMQKCGLQLEARLMSHTLIDGVYCDRLEYGLSMADWKASRQPR